MSFDPAAIRRQDDFVLQNVAGEHLLVPIGAQVMDLNGIIILNETGAYLWEVLAQERSLDELAAAVADEFDVEPDAARADVQAFLDEIAQIGLLV